MINGKSNEMQGASTYDLSGRGAAGPRTVERSWGFPNHSETQSKRRTT
jgi:hypothetical protein